MTNFILKPWRLKAHYLPLLLGLYFALVINIPLAAKLHGILELLPTYKIGFAISLPIFLTCFFTILFSLFSIKFIEKPLFIVVLIISSVISYATYQYGVIFDEDMLVNFLQTNVAEGSSYISLPSTLWVMLMGVLPSFFITKVQLVRTSLIKDLTLKVFSILGSGTMIFVIGLFYYEDYVTIGRNNHGITRYAIPTHLVYSIGKHVKKEYLVKPAPYMALGLDAKDTSPLFQGKHALFILVVGETARGMNYELNGYARTTNRYTKPLNVISYQDVQACGTATATSLPCMFSNLPRLEFTTQKASNQDNLVDILNRAKLNLLWLENDGGCKGVCDKIPHETINPKQKPWCDGLTCYDEVFLEGLQERIDRLKGKNAFLVLHIIGSHGPTYYERYPQSHKIFQPDCPRSDIQNCTQEELVNTYDNTILYTDFVISRLIEVLKKNESDWNTGLLYLSDHGESLGEHGLYLHGFPYSLAPKEQTHVPFITWFSEGFAEGKKLDLNCLKHDSNTKAYTHDNLFHSMLGLMDVSTTDYDSQLDMFKSCRKTSKEA